VKARYFANLLARTQVPGRVHPRHCTSVGRLPSRLDSQRIWKLALIRMLRRNAERDLLRNAEEVSYWNPARPKIGVIMDARLFRHLVTTFVSGSSVLRQDIVAQNHCVPQWASIHRLYRAAGPFSSPPHDLLLCFQQDSLKSYRGVLRGEWAKNNANVSWPHYKSRGDPVMWQWATGKYVEA